VSPPERFDPFIERLPMLRSVALVFAFALRALAGAPAAAQETVAYVGATLWDGTGAAPVEGAALVVQGGRVVAAGRVEVPAGARVENVSGRWIIPGLVDAHAHVTGRWAPESTTDLVERVKADLGIYARYGVTTAVSLGGEPDAAFALRAENASASLARTRLYVAGAVVSSNTADQARAAVRANADRGVDWIKIRVDDNLGASAKMPIEAARAAIEEAHARGLKAAAHIFYLGDAEALLGAGIDMIAHSVRDADVTEDTIRMLRQRNVCYAPTLTREISAFVYARRPSFFDDPFFRSDVFAAEVARVTAPQFQQQMQTSTAAARYREALVKAQKNLGLLSEGDVRIAFGTDAGQAARFPGYFEHLELSLMVEAGLTPEQALRSATGVAAECMGLPDVGTLESGKWSDFLVLTGDPLAGIEATRALDAVYIAGNRVR
jgi:imidazolonepropionase-like amidohydrolase